MTDLYNEAYQAGTLFQHSAPTVLGGVEDLDIVILEPDSGDDSLWIDIDLTDLLEARDDVALTA